MRSPVPFASRRPVFVAALVALLMLSGSLTLTQDVRAADPAPIEGIDISHWQGDIDWPQVGDAGKAFAFMKASEGTTFVDPTYGLNRARARAAGLKVGAYHFAQPGATLGDATAEADHFLATADISHGDLPPVLDLERVNGLTPTALQDWAKEFLERIHDRTGVRGAIYTSPNFWKNYVGGSDWFAMNGYRVLWVADWRANPSPEVPASDWAGFGWTFWQYTSDGTVPGIVGRVDLDRFDGEDLSSVAIELAGVGDPPPPPFTDISGSSFKGDIAWLYASGITTGCSKTKFCPTGKVTRGQMASFLARALELPKATKDYFSDDDGSTHEANINRLAKAGLTSGCSATRYCPNGAVSRAQLATFLARVLDLSATSNDYFVDDESSTHESNINRIARAGLTSGCSATRYCPSSALTRGQMAAFLHRTFGY